MQERFRDRLQREFAQRRGVNARYSLRAFAAFLGADHSTLSQILRGERPLPIRSLRSWARQLELEPAAIAAYVAVEHLPDATTLARESQLRHWTAEAATVMNDSVHWEIYRLLKARRWRADTRWMAKQIGDGVTVDQINVAFARLLRLRILKTDASGRWRDALPTPISSERDFQRIALARVRELAAGVDVKLPRTIKLA
jgi:transcriptional regulator with XRE-family HTH domain